MKKNYVAPETVVMQFQDVEELCNGLTGWSANNETDGSNDSIGDTYPSTDPPFGTAGSKKFDAWSTWDEDEL